MTTYEGSTVAIFALTLTFACGDDGGMSEDDPPTTIGTSGDPSTGEPRPGTGSESTADASSTGEPPASTSEASTGSSEESSSSGAPDEGEYAALVRGALVTDDLEEAQALHDAIAMGGEEAAMALGDFGHDAKLGTALLGTTENEYMALDQWDNLAGAQMLYADPDFQAAFGMLFAAAPSLELFRLHGEWHGWGDPQSGDAGDHWFVVVRGRLAEKDIEAAQAMHDPIAAGGEEAATAAGDVAHVVWLGVEDEREYFALDVWTDDANIEAFYGNPDFMAAVATLFEGSPTIAVYRSTDWHQW